MNIRPKIAGGLVSLGLAASGHGHEVMDLEQLTKTFGWDFATAAIRTEKVSDRLHVLFGVGGNIAVSTGDNGVLVVDDQFPQILSKVQAAIGALGGGDIDFAINTHWHFDHAESNAALGAAGTWLVSQTNAREMMKNDHVVNLVIAKYGQKAYPEVAWPHITYNERMQFHFNGETIDLVHAGPAHTTGDTAVIFRDSNAVHLGDVFNNSGYPFIDVDNGGDLTGVIGFCKAVLDEIDGNTVVIPGHGPIATQETLVAYVAMLELLRGRILGMIREGKSLEEVLAAQPTRDFDEKQGDPAGFVNRAYTSLRLELDRS
ncbi:MAG: MBL fold metallo-hydrolase [Pseudomonadales bacterium]